MQDLVLHRYIGASALLYNCYFLLMITLYGLYAYRAIYNYIKIYTHIDPFVCILLLINESELLTWGYLMLKKKPYISIVRK